MIHGRPLRLEEVPRVWEIDRREVITRMGRVVDGAVVWRDERHDVAGWPAGEREKYTPILQDCRRRGGWVYGLFESAGPKERLIGAAVLDGEPLPTGVGRHQLVFLHVGRAHRGAGHGKALFRLAAEEARSRGAMSLYISATPSEPTVRFYLGRGCVLTRELDPALFAAEPEDIHLEYGLG